VINRDWHNNSFANTSIGIIGVLVMLIVPFAVLADDEQVGSKDETELLTSLGEEAPLSEDQLDDQRARAKLEVHRVTINNQELNGVVTNNTAINNETGNNIISDGAFNSAAGFISTVQNSGNNVLIQNSTIINVAVEP
jgi:hypothetical protein